MHNRLLCQALYLIPAGNGAWKLADKIYLYRCGIRLSYPTMWLPLGSRGMADLCFISFRAPMRYARNIEYRMHALF